MGMGNWLFVICYWLFVICVDSQRGDKKLWIVKYLFEYIYFIGELIYTLLPMPNS